MGYPKTLFALHFLLLTISCGIKDSGKPTPSKPPSGYTDTLEIKNSGLIVYRPGSNQLDALRTSLDSSLFESLMHDYEFMLKAALSFASGAPETKDLPILKVKDARFLLFKMNKGDTLIDLDQLGDPVGLFFFDPGKKPRLVDLPNISSELPYYFNSLGQ